ncbi:Flp pilus assembly protein TadD, contains TPR repeats [Ferrimonas sediminum]|uniref:Flp pilus assembly protein TadD, contains TPR repeats n=1 Tax=Ferrimonas sediminum TaxID=718193 RepID=A0A1G8YDC6_9GAMM|nr:tetratricopeptide repeat protein [Ferrimonas sediminum]SDK00663.1 Flp pilus assembly protein TadD, contains TPR repeats [Ferrimonas sediminum]
MTNKLLSALLTVMLALQLGGCASTPETPAFQPPDINSLLSQAQAAQQRRQYDVALKHYLEALEQQPENADILFHIGQVQTQLGNSEYALHAFQDVLKQEPDNIEALTALALHKLKAGENRQARTYLTKAKNLDQQRLLSASHQVLVGDGNEQPLQPLDKTSPLRCYNALGILHDLSGEYPQAREMYQLVLDRAPGAANVLTNLGYSYYLDGNLRQAEIHLRQAVQKQPDFKRAWTNLGLVYARMKHYKRALVSLKQVMPEADALNDLGYFAMLEGRYADAKELFWRAIDASPTYFAKAQDNLEKLQELQGKSITAHSSYRPLPLLMEANYKAEVSNSATVEIVGEN